MRTHERTEITRNGTRAAVLLGADDYDSMLETLDIVSDATLVAELQRSLDELAAGDVLTTDDVLPNRPAGRRPAKHNAGAGSPTLARRPLSSGQAR